MVGFLQKRLRVPRGVSAGIGVSMTVSLVTILLFCLCALLIRELGSLGNALPDWNQTAKNGFSLVQNWMLRLSVHTPASLQPVLRENLNRFFSDGAAFLDKLFSYLLGLAGSLLSHIPDSAFSLGTAFLSAFLISAKLPKMRRNLLRHIPRERLSSLEDTWKRVRRIFGSWCTAQCKLVGVSFVILFLGLVILQIPHALLWAALICLVDAFPILGTGTVLLPWSLFFLLQGDTARAVGLISTYVVVTVSRSTLEPKFLSHHLGLDPLVTLIALYVGFRLWGIGGMILAPLVAVAAIQLVPDRQEG
jgi:sporulation integral membrane protein YtvI